MLPLYGWQGRDQRIGSSPRLTPPHTIPYTASLMTKPSTPSRTAAKPARLKLPTAAAFSKLSLPKRQGWFLRWIRAQPPRRHIDVMDSTDCPMGQFGQALIREKRQGCGGANWMHLGHGLGIEVLVNGDPLDTAIYGSPRPATMGQLKALLKGVTL